MTERAVDNRSVEPGDDKDDFMRLMRERYDRGAKGDEQNRLDAEDDLKFVAGEQYPDDVKRERLAQKKSLLTINRLPQFVRQVTGDIRQNKPAIKVRPVDGQSDPERAKILTGLIRNIEQCSDADTAYITGAENCARCGMGHWRIDTEFSDDDSFVQDIRIRRIANPFAVIWDPLARELDKSDASYCFVVTTMSKAEFKAQYPDATEQDFAVDTAQTQAERAPSLWSSWVNGDEVRVAEYWLKEPQTKRLVQLDDGSVIDASQWKGKDAPPELAGRTIARERQVKTYRVRQYLVSGAEVLEGPTDWAGRYIPIITVPGEEIHLGERTVRHGLVRFAKDPQRLFNYMRSTSADVIALQPKAPYKVTPKNILGYESIWQNAGTINYPYLPFNPDPEAANYIPSREQPPVAASGLITEAGLAADDMKAVTGIYDASLGQRSNESSGRAILARQREGDTGTYVYIDNLSKAIAYTGRQLVDLIPRIYDTERMVRILGEDGAEEMVAINKAAIQNGQPVTLNDLSLGKYDVVVETGPSYATKRTEAADSMMQFVQAVPAAGQVAADLIAKNMDWPGADKISERLAKMLPPGLADNSAPPQPPPPNPKDVAAGAKSAADADLSKAKAEGVHLDNAMKALQLDQMAGAINQQMGAMLQAILPHALADALAALSGQTPPSAMAQPGQPPMQPNMPPPGGMPIAPLAAPGPMDLQAQPAPAGQPGFNPL